MKKLKKTPAKQEQVIVLKDGAGNYYEISRANLDRSKVRAARKKKVEAALMSTPGHYEYIFAALIPGSVAAPKFIGGMQLHYAGFYLRPRRRR
jgi:hypothetical protein